MVDFSAMWGGLLWGLRLRAAIYIFVKCRLG